MDYNFAYAYVSIYPDCNNAQTALEDYRMPVPIKSKVLNDRLLPIFLAKKWAYTMSGNNVDINLNGGTAECFGTRENGESFEYIFAMDAPQKVSIFKFLTTIAEWAIKCAK